MDGPATFGLLVHLSLHCLLFSISGSRKSFYQTGAKAGLTRGVKPGTFNTESLGFSTKLRVGPSAIVQCTTCSVPPLAFNVQFKVQSFWLLKAARRSGALGFNFPLLCQSSWSVVQERWVIYEQAFGEGGERGGTRERCS